MIQAGLLSAIVTAFVIEVYRTLQPDSGALSASILLHISQQLASMSESPGASSTKDAFAVREFQAPKYALRVNILWFVSLVISLFTASLSMLAKQWLREYLAGRQGTPEECIRLRQLRYDGLLKWRVFDIVALLPLLLHISLILFFIGLGDFLLVLDTEVGSVVSTLIGTWLFIYAACLTTPALLHDCPYVIPLTKTGILRFRRSVWKLWCKLQQFFRDKHPRLHKYYKYPGDEIGARHDARLDLPALIAAVEIFRDDTFLDEIVRPCLNHFSGRDNHIFLHAFLQKRLHCTISLASLPFNAHAAVDFRQMSTRAIVFTVDTLCGSLERAVSQSNDVMEQWAQETLGYVFAAVEHCYQSGRFQGVLTWDSVMSLLTRLLTCQDHSVIATTVLYASQYPTTLGLVKPSEIPMESTSLYPY